MIKIIKSDEHYRNQSDWLDTTHHFSFGEYFNPDKMNFGPLRVFNDDTIKPATGFDFECRGAQLFNPTYDQMLQSQKDELTADTLAKMKIK